MSKEKYSLTSLFLHQMEAIVFVIRGSPFFHVLLAPRILRSHFFFCGFLLCYTRTK